MSGHPGDPDPPTAELDEEQHVEAFEQDGVDVEEVRGHDARRLGTQELTPGGAAVAGEQGRGRGPRMIWAMVLAARRTPSLTELTLDAPVAPPRVLPGQAHDEGRRLVVDGRATR